MNIRVVVPLLTVLALAACSSDADKATDLKQYLADQRSFETDYAAVKGADITYNNGDVVIKAKTTSATSGQTVCNWVSDWLYSGNGGDASTIRVMSEDGFVLSQRKHTNDVCSFGSGS